MQVEKKQSLPVYRAHVFFLWFFFKMRLLSPCVLCCLPLLCLYSPTPIPHSRVHLEEQHRTSPLKECFKFHVPQQAVSAAHNGALFVSTKMSRDKVSRFRNTNLTRRNAHILHSQVILLTFFLHMHTCSLSIVLQPVHRGSRKSQ